MFDMFLLHDHLTWLQGHSMSNRHDVQEKAGTWPSVACDTLTRNIAWQLTELEAKMVFVPDQ